MPEPDPRAVLATILDSERSRLAAVGAGADARALADRLVLRLETESIVLPPPDGDAFFVANALAFTRWALVGLAPTSLERVAAYLDAVRNREPMRSGDGWAQERQVLGCLVTDLRSIVRDAGEPVGEQRDLRDARTRQDEVMARARADGAIRAYQDLIDGIVEHGERERAAASRHVPADPDPAPVPALPEL